MGGLRSLSILAVLAAAPAYGQSWQAEVRVGPEITIERYYQGTTHEYAPEAVGVEYGNMQGFFGPYVSTEAGCDEADWFEIDLAFGQTGYVAVQLLFGLEKIGRDQWRVDFPAAFLNIETADDFSAVLLERYEGAEVRVIEVACDPDGLLTVDVEYSFSGPPDTSKGPSFLDVSGRVRGTMSLANYDQY